MDDLIEEIVDGICSEIADEAVEGAADYASSAPVNAGQESLCFEIEDQIYEAWEEVFEGEPGIYIESDHPEAIGIICEVCSEILNAAAEACSQIRNAADLFDLFG